ncbi:MAG: orotidine-5'-phosphate decarboxylase [Chloroflexi bacterium]|nr:orotidine-5'-phosphate decarboxylase [Chloroflexota bacterium]
MSFFSRLEERASKIDSLLCVGLDPHPADLKENTPQAAKEFCLNLIEATSGLAVAFKPNSAFFEALGPGGMTALLDVIAAVPDEIPVILDAKRGDISSTAQAYAQAVFEIIQADAVTISPYLGADSISPFLQDSEKGVFLLCKTSNPGSNDIQTETLQSGLKLYEHIAQLALGWNTKDNLGLVVGATHPEALSEIRGLAPNMWILAPGVGAQGADLLTAVQAGLRTDGLGLLVPVSRGISRAEDPGEAANSIREAINQARKNRGSKAEPKILGKLAQNLFEAGCVKFGQFTLKSGLESPIYIDLRQLASYPNLLTQVAKAYQDILKGFTFDRIAAIPYAGLPIGTAVSLGGNWPMIYPRKEVKEYGAKAEIEGEFKTGEKVVVIDDLTTTGGTKFEAFEKLENAGLKVKDIVVLIDRESGAKEALAEAGYRLHAVFGLAELVTYLKNQGQITADEMVKVINFIKESASNR